MMFRRIGLVPIIAAAAFVVAGCNHRSAEAPANNAAAAEANGAQSNAAYSSGGSPTGGTCGGITGTQCASASDFCKHPTGQCNVADGQGTCTRRPEICTDVRIPVCGCDGRTYDNACRAAAAGVSVQAAGECRATAASETNSAAAQ